MKKLLLLLLVFTLSVEVNSQNICFYPDTVLLDNYGQEEQGICIADLNNDGKKDLVIKKAYNDTISVSLGNGMGSFGASINYPFIGGLSVIISADFNNDGNADIAAISNDSTNIYILQGNGVGSFSNIKSVSCNAPPSSLICNDFNNDGKIDLATSNVNANNITVLLNNGVGSFSAPTNYPVFYAWPYYILSADFNEDGNSDLVTLNYNHSGPPTINLFLGTGTGNFGAAVNFAIGGYYSGSYFTLSDLNNDNHVDIAVIGDSLYVLFGTGTGNFNYPKSFTTSNYPTSINSADFNNDLNTDIAITNSSAIISILLGTGTGSFSYAPNINITDYPQSITCSDINGDGKADLALTTYSTSAVHILLNCSNPNTNIVNSYSLTQEMQVDPNPVISSLWLSLPDTIFDDNQVVFITNVFGDIIKHYTVNKSTLQIDVSDLSAGVYFIRVKRGIKKFIKQ